MENLSVTLVIVGLVCTILGAVWSLAWWLSGHFSAIRKDFYALGKEILDKLEYHERHDDQRFSQIRDDIWDIRVRLEKHNLNDIRPRENNANI